MTAITEQHPAGPDERTLHFLVVAAAGAALDEKIIPQWEPKHIRQAYDLARGMITRSDERYRATYSPGRHGFGLELREALNDEILERIRRVFVEGEEDA